MNCKNNCNYRSNMQSHSISPVSGLSKTTCDTRPSSDLPRISYDMLQGFPLAMAYVPKQHYDQMFNLSTGLKNGTIFPELCLPFCGKRRKCSC